MPYAIMAIDKPGAAALRAELRPTHLEYLERNAGKLLGRRRHLRRDGTTPIGSLIMYRSLRIGAEVEAFIAGDPFTKAGLFQRVTFIPGARYTWLANACSECLRYAPAHAHRPPGRQAGGGYHARM